MLNKIILIGGVPGTGKTTLARKIALDFNIEKIIELDTFKSIIKLYIKEDKYINTTTHDAYKIENTNYLDGYIKHCNCLQKYLLEYIKTIQKDEIIIIEGAQLTPNIINSLKEFDILYINLNETKDTLLERYNKKRRKSNWEEDIDCIISISDYLKTFNVIQTSIKTINKNIIANFLSRKE